VLPTRRTPAIIIEGLRVSGGNADYQLEVAKATRSCRKKLFFSICHMVGFTKIPFENMIIKEHWHAIIRPKQFYFIEQTNNGGEI